MNDYFYNPIKLLFGTKATDQIPEDLKITGNSKPLIVLQKELSCKKKNKALSLFTYSQLPVVAKITISDNEQLNCQQFISAVLALKTDSILIFTNASVFLAILKCFDSDPKSFHSKKPIMLCWIPTGKIDLNSFLEITLRVRTSLAENTQKVNFNFSLMVIDPVFSTATISAKKETARTAYFIVHQLLKQEKSFNDYEKSFLSAALKLSNYAICTSFSSNKSLLLAHHTFYFLLSILIHSQIKWSPSIKEECQNFLQIKNQKIPKETLVTIPSPSFYEFYAPVTIVSGHNSIQEIATYLQKLGAKRPFLIVTRSIYNLGLCSQFIKKFPKSITIGYETSDIPQDSDVPCVEALAKEYIQNECDAIIAIGGGSVIDTAKGINILATHKYGKLKDFSGSFTIRKKLNPLIVVPTTSGTGSEVTVVSVIADKNENKKLLFLSWYLLPSVAILDPQMTLTLPPYLSAATGMDALCHAIEAVVSTAKNNASHELALTAIVKIINYLPIVLQEPKNKEARLQMAIASNLAGIAFSNAMVGIVHTLAHATGAITHIAHGNLISIFLPYGLEYNLHKNAFMLSEIYRNIHPDLYIQSLHVHNAISFIDEIKSFTSHINELLQGNFPCCLKDVKTKEGKAAMSLSQIPKIAATALNDGSVLYSGEQLSLQEAKELLEAAWDGRELDHSILLKGHQR